MLDLKSLESYLQSLIDAKLWVKVIVALIVGIAFGMLISPESEIFPPSLAPSLGGWLSFPGKLFLKMVQMIMIPLIFASIITGIVNTDVSELKKTGIRAGIYFLSTTAISITLGVILAMVIKPGKSLYKQSEKLEGNTLGESVKEGNILQSIPDAITGLLPENPIASMVSGEMLAIVVFTIIVGMAIVQIKEDFRKPIIRVLAAIQEICMTIVSWAMRIVPFAVFGLMMQLTSSIGVQSIKGVLLYIITVLVGLIILLLIYMVLLVFLGRTNPIQFLSKIREVQLLAFSTTSSAAVMPLSIKTAEDELGIKKSISNFLIPIGATINMDGTALYQCVSTIFIAQAYGLELSIASIIPIIFTIVAASVGTPAIPGGGIVILASVLQGVGIPAEGIVLIIGVERILGMFRTAINVTGDLTACVIFNRLS